MVFKGLKPKGKLSLIPKEGKTPSLEITPQAAAEIVLGGPIPPTEAESVLEQKTQAQEAQVSLAKESK